jgi:limonene-1,2-epoxide hydrolase
MSAEENRKLVMAMWNELYAKNFSAACAYMADDGLYEDVPAPDGGAVGPANVERRLRIGLEPVERFEHDIHRVVAADDTVVIEHTETWHFGTGDKIRNDFVTIHVVKNGKIALWRDYWDLNTLMSQAPQWWIERIMKHQGEEFA